MDTLTEQVTKADRLANITQRIGYALWQLQELEGAAATYFVLLTAAKPGMGTEAGDILVAKAKGKTFGSTIKELAKARLLSEGLGGKFQALLAERNWLVHSSRADSRGAVCQPSQFAALIFRLDRIAEDTLALLREVGQLTERFALSHGVQPQEIDALTVATLKLWHEQDAI
jgi:hypothetical protein